MTARHHFTALSTLTIVHNAILPSAFRGHLSSAVRGQALWGKIPRRAAIPTEVGPLQKAAVIPGIRIKAACGATIRPANPMLLCACESTPWLIVRARYMVVLALTADSLLCGKSAALWG